MKRLLFVVFMFYRQLCISLAKGSRQYITMCKPNLAQLVFLLLNQCIHKSSSMIKQMGTHLVSDKLRRLQTSTRFGRWLLGKCFQDGLGAVFDKGHSIIVIWLGFRHLISLSVRFVPCASLCCKPQKSSHNLKVRYWRQRRGQKAAA